MTESVFLSPKSIAVIGASDKEGSVGRAITSNIMKGYKGTVYPISPTRNTVFDQQAYKSVLDVPNEVDLAVIITKNTIVPTVLEECGKKKIQGAIVITAGFKEVDEEGKKLEQQLKDISKKYNLRIIGPNCLGVMNLEPQTMMNSTFLKITPKSGEIALVSQSGAICAALVEDASAQGIGFSAVISMGNKADMTEIDVLKMLADHEQTKVIVMYLEDMGDGQEFLNVCKQITKKNTIKKPVLVLKSGRSPEGAKVLKRMIHYFTHSWLIRHSREPVFPLFGWTSGCQEITEDICGDLHPVGPTDLHPARGDHLHGPPWV